MVHTSITHSYMQRSSSYTHLNLMEHIHFPHLLMCMRAYVFVRLYCEVFQTNTILASVSQRFEVLRLNCVLEQRTEKKRAY